MASPVKSESCRLCCCNLPKKSRRSIFSNTFGVYNQLNEILGYVPTPNDNKSPFVCQHCFTKLNKLAKLEYDIEHKMAALRTQRHSLVAELRQKYLLENPHKDTPKKQGKRVIYHSPTPRKVKMPTKQLPTPTRTSPGLKPTLLVQQPKSSRKRLILSETEQSTSQSSVTSSSSKATKVLSPGKVKVLYRGEKQEKLTSKVVNKSEFTEIIKSIAKGNSISRIGSKILKSKLGKPIEDLIVRDIARCCAKLCGRQSVLYETSSSKLEDFKFELFNVQFQQLAPFLYKIIDCLTKGSEKLNVVVMSILLRCRNNHISRLHHIIAQVLDHGGATNETIDIMNKLGLSVSSSALAKKRAQLEDSQKDRIKNLILDEKEEDEESFKKTKSGKSAGEKTVMKSSQIIGDNIDINRNPSQMSKERQRKSWHWFLLVGLSNRVTFEDLPDDGPQCEITTLENNVFIPNDQDLSGLDENLIFHIMHVLVKYIPCFHEYESSVPAFINHPHMKATSEKSDYVILDLLNKSENKNDDMICILKHIHDKYISHTDDDDPMVIKKKVFGGDVLTNERAYEGQLAMMNSPTDFTRLKGVVHRPEGLHRMMNFLLFIYQRFYKAKSALDAGTLYQLRNVVSRLQVKGADRVIESYRAHLSFVEDTLDSYIVGSCLHLLNMEDLDSTPPRTPIFCDDDKYDYIHGVAEKILTKYVKTQNDIEHLRKDAAEIDRQRDILEDMLDVDRGLYVCTCGKVYKMAGWLKQHLMNVHKWKFVSNSPDKDEPEKNDHIAIYRSAFMKCALLLRDTKDAFKLADGDRILRNAKFEMLCADVGGHIKYRLWLFRFIAYCVSLLSPKQAMEYKWNCTANTTGGKDKNIPNDNLVELFVQTMKKKIHQQGANATFESARKAAMSVQVQDSIRTNISHECGMKPSGKKRATVSKLTDMKLILAELAKTKVFDNIPGRQFNGFPDIKDVFSCVKVVKLCEWITEKKNTASYQLI